MIKLIATDLDGTLLQNGAQDASERILNQINRLHKQGIIFVAASGRQYPNLYHLFRETSKNIAFICENGALVIYKDTVIAKSKINKTISFALIDDIYQQENCEVLVSGQNTSYIKPKEETYTNHMVNIVKNTVEIVNDFKEIKEDIIKISVYKKNGIMEDLVSYFINKWQNNFTCTVSGHAWLDFVNSSVNKGRALKILLDHFNIPASQTMAFGDNYNDLEMLSLVKYGYVMENSNEKIKSMYQYHSVLVEDTIDEILMETFHIP